MEGRKWAGLDSKGAGSWEVPVTTLPSRIDGVVEGATRICRRNFFAVSILVVQRAFRTRYQIPLSGPSTGPKMHSVVG